VQSFGKSRTLCSTSKTRECKTVQTQSPDQMRCPTCKARQEWAETCRRCKCDLRLLRAAERAYHRFRQACLQNLYAGCPAKALRAANACRQLRPGVESYRLLALCHLLEENWAEALEGASRAHDESLAPRRERA
jgi:hypothetical protein